MLFFTYFYLFSHCHGKCFCFFCPQINSTLAKLDFFCIRITAFGTVYRIDNKTIIILIQQSQ